MQPSGWRIDVGPVVPYPRMGVVVEVPCRRQTARTECVTRRAAAALDARGIPVRDLLAT